MKTDKQFFEALEESFTGVVWVAIAVVQRRPDVRVRAVVDIAAPRSIHAGRYHDIGDVYANSHRYEVKRRPKISLPNFPHNSMFLGETYKVTENIRGFFVVGRERRPIWYFSAANREKWFLTKCFSPVDDRPLKVVTAPLNIAEVWE